jgi:hypothetical protein
MLLNNLEIIERQIELSKFIKNNIFIKEKTKRVLLDVIIGQTERHIDIIIKKLEQDNKNYATMIKGIIIDDLGFIKNNIK